ncbi:MAG: hypothetical protein KDE51_21080, partial [Anaerolineales bacterium]|nr:hypothetical protein [Anaerolineales bacterium]
MIKKISYANIVKLAFLLLVLGAWGLVRLNGEAAVTTDEALLDTKFGVGYGPNEDGSIPLGNNLTYEAIATQEDGKVVIAGRNFSTVSRLTRYEEDGSLDLSFGTQGEVILSGGIKDMAIQPDGKIVVSGSKEDDFMVARFLTNGLPDTSFSGDGVATVNFDGGFDSASQLIIQQDGKIVLGGHARDCRTIGPCGFNDDLALARFNADGSIDNSFDGDGKVAFSLLDSNHEYITNLKIDTNGDIIATGNTEQGDDSVVTLARISENGSFVDSFDGDGRLITDNRAFGVTNHLIFPDGKIGFPVLDDRGVTRRVTLTRVSPNGEPDLSFGEDGYVVAPAGFTTHALSSPLLLPPFPNGDFLYIGDSSSEIGRA